jgi:hypothetical protein
MVDAKRRTTLSAKAKQLNMFVPRGGPLTRMFSITNRKKKRKKWTLSYTTTTIPTFKEYYLSTVEGYDLITVDNDLHGYSWRL